MFSFCYTVSMENLIANEKSIPIKIVLTFQGRVLKDFVLNKRRLDI